MRKTLVAYFSASGVTAGVAKKLAEICGGDLYEIKPEVPYTSADLNWMDKKSRSTLEMNAKTSRPAMADELASIEEYDTILVGFPIWWYTAPRIIETFLESYDFSGKRIAVFATSGGSGLGGTEAALKAVCKGSVKWLSGRVLPADGAGSELTQWLSEIGL